MIAGHSPRTKTGTESNQPAPRRAQLLRGRTMPKLAAKTISALMAEYGQKGGLVKSKKKAKSSANNGKKGGRPRKNKEAAK